MAPSYGRGPPRFICRDVKAEEAPQGFIRLHPFVACYGSCQLQFRVFHWRGQNAKQINKQTLLF
jgi:hypothetical protein